MARSGGHTLTITGGSLPHSPPSFLFTSVGCFLPVVFVVNVVSVFTGLLQVEMIKYDTENTRHR